MKSFGTPKYGLVFTSMSHVLKSSSIRKSYPKSSYECYQLREFNSVQTKVSMIKSFILGTI